MYDKNVHVIKVILNLKTELKTEQIDYKDIIHRQPKTIFNSPLNDLVIRI